MPAQSCFTSGPSFHLGITTPISRPEEVSCARKALGPGQRADLEIGPGGGQWPRVSPVTPCASVSLLGNGAESLLPGLQGGQAGGWPWSPTPLSRAGVPVVGRAQNGANWLPSRSGQAGTMQSGRAGVVRVAGQTGGSGLSCS